MFQVCMCGASPGYPHQETCPYPSFGNSPPLVEKWEKTQNEKCSELIEQAGPEEDDYVTSDHRTFFQCGKVAVVAAMEDEFSPKDWRPYVRKHMEDNNFFPNVWFLSDHGNYHLLSIEED